MFLSGLSFNRKFLVCFIYLILCCPLSTFAIMSHPSTMWEALDYYGFTEESQKEALQELLQKADVDTYLLFFSKVYSNQELLPKIFQLVTVTQECFARRNDNKEPWQVKPAAWMCKDIASSAKQLAALGITAEVLPRQTATDVLCLLGATRYAMQTRMNFATDLVRNNFLSAKYLVMLAGERYITPGLKLDGSRQQLSALARELNKTTDQLTETDLMYSVYETSYFYNKIDTTVIDTPKRDLPRPTTESTVKEFIIWLREYPQFRKITFISNQPYVGYQYAIISGVFEQNGLNFSPIEVIGNGIDITTNPTLAKVVEVASALGAQIWAQTPAIIESLGIKIPPQYQAEFSALYQKQPLLHLHVAKSFSSK